MYLYFTKKSCFAKRNKEITSTEAREHLDALHSGDSQDSANSDLNSNLSLSDSLPSYSLHDDGHRLPKMDEIDYATSRQSPRRNNGHGSYSMVSVIMFILIVSLRLLGQSLTVHA